MIAPRCSIWVVVLAAAGLLGAGYAEAGHRGHGRGHGSHYSIGIHYVGGHYGGGHYGSGYRGGGPGYYRGGPGYYRGGDGGHGGATEYRWARVVEVTPIHASESEPVYREECRTELVEEVHGNGYYRRPRYARSGPILGAIAGGLIGNQIGSGGGRVAATVAGATLGHAVAVDRQHARNYVPPATRVVEREVCRQVADGYRQTGFIEGYDVAYEFGGRIFHARTEEDPGERIRIPVRVRPAY